MKNKRVTLACRVSPVTKGRLEKLSDDTELSYGRLIDMMVYEKITKLNK